MNYCVFFHDQKFHKYFIYKSDGEYYESYTKPDIDNFEFSKLTKKKLNEKLAIGIDMKTILKDYSESYLIWRNEILSSKILIKKYDFFLETFKDDGTKFINTNESNIYRFFNNYSSKIYKNETFEKIIWMEYKWFETNYNGSLQRCVPGKYECLGYDLSMAYPNILSSQLIINNSKKSFYFPKVQGKEENIKSIPNKLKYGLYNVQIKSSNKDFLFIFCLNDSNIYTHYDINFCIKYKEKFEIEITLLNTDKINCLTYLNKNCIDGEQVFKMWLDRLKSLKEEFPKNGLIKMLSSSIWGYLSKINKRYYNDKELDENPNIKFDIYDSEEINYIMLNEKDNKDGSIDYQLVNKLSPYCKNYRLKPFLTSFTRLIMAEIAIEIGINKIVRINTDNLTFNKDLLTNEDLKKINKISPQFIEEDKTTGKFDIVNLNNFIRL